MQKDSSGGNNGGVRTGYLKTDHVYHHLKRFLVFQNVPPRTKLDMNTLARRMGVSTTPVREAILRLADEGVLSHVPGGGYFSKPLSFDEISEDYDIALNIIKHAIARNISSFTDNGPQLPKVSNIENPAPEIILNFCCSIEHLAEFMAGLTGNSRVMSAIHAFNRRTSFIRLIDLQRLDRFKQIITDMNELVDFLIHHDASGAIDNLERQRNRKVEILRELVKEGNLRALSASDELNISL
jgi:DNA-binding GntR family transcriptional regulator